ncbi:MULTISPECIES: YIP1 family protein [Streptomyces]|uniref:Membrane protein n=2 Tax=Streptomyces fradiae TaxID=1906 RepID=A0A1Y2NQN6_STRFR|nr:MULTISPECIES: YIP1 family protein [Streptomyces]KAF0650951.1 membrane protein [Streptomyces fradiae ATCC 10745 = DSM 40063]OSY49825.1 Yip1 domain protein [Streptomyces fradiae ATCC 10745 = DSM 40063]QEV13235.1 YIP1 family protein [Streptomyces fradiae ATCC 10745 = DSM 40063]UQS31525.1 YIP1 family protein [Streptomyces fradiae]
MAGFRIGRGRDNRTPHQRGQQAPHTRQGPHGSAGAPAPPPYATPQHQWPRDGRTHGEPEYFGDPYHQQQHGAPHPHHPQQPYGSHEHPPAQAHTANNPGHTQMFSVHDDPYGPPDTYQAGAAAPSGPRLPWQQLLTGIVARPGPTFLRMRDHAVWVPALTVTFVYGLLALFGFDKAREETINSTLATAVPAVLVTAVMFVVGGLILGAVTHTLARQLGGDGAWQPTVGLSMLIMSMTDAPRLLFAMFLGGENGLVQVIGWLSWVAAGALFTSMVSKSHDLPWPKALGASAIQLAALLSLIKLGTL